MLPILDSGNQSSGNFTVFNQCGKLTANRTAQGNHLLIKFVSNSDVLTSKGFQIHLRGNNYINISWKIVKRVRFC